MKRNGLLASFSSLCCFFLSLAHSTWMNVHIYKHTEHTYIHNIVYIFGSVSGRRSPNGFLENFSVNSCKWIQLKCALSMPLCIAIYLVMPECGVKSGTEHIHFHSYIMHNSCVYTQFLAAAMLFLCKCNLSFSL